MASVLTVEGLCKSFFGSQVLHGIDLEVEAGEVHALVGENGAGKSTLMKILAGVQSRDAGVVRLEGEEVHFTHPLDAYAAGLSTVFQEFNLLPDRTVAENILLGREPKKFGLVQRSVLNSRARALLEDIGVDSISPTALVRSLSVAEQQIVEIAKALSFNPRIISMDEPTAALADHEVELLYAIVRKLSARGVAVLYVSHRMREIFDLCEKITVLKDGALIATVLTKDTTEVEIVRLMVGRSLQSYFPEPRALTCADQELLTLTGVGNDQVDSISFTLKKGEILGVAGLQGSGRTELLEGIAGIRPFSRGEMLLAQTPYAPKTPGEAIDRRVACVTEDRKGSGLGLGQSVANNALAIIQSRFPASAKESAKKLPDVFDQLGLAARGPDQEVQFLSGGNQQKVVFAKWLLIKPDLFLLDEPTRGIDVGAKRAIYERMRDLTEQGVGIIMVSSELPEVIGMSDRILVMNDGRIAGVLGPNPSEEEVLALAAGTGEAA